MIFYPECIIKAKGKNEGIFYQFILKRMESNNYTSKSINTNPFNSILHFSLFYDMKKSLAKKKDVIKY